VAVRRTASLRAAYDPRIHLLFENDGLPGLAASRLPGNDSGNAST
jgi:hypothetical protein